MFVKESEKNTENERMKQKGSEQFGSLSNVCVLGFIHTYAYRFDSGKKSEHAKKPTQQKQNETK